MKAFLAWLMRSRTARIGLTAVLGVFRLFSPISGGIVALTVLRLGWLEGVATALVASLVLAAVGAGLLQGGWLVLMLPALVGWAVVIALAELLRRTASLAWVVQAATALACLGVALFFLANPNPVPVWTPVLKDLLMPVLKNSATGANQNWTLIIQRMAMLMTGVVGASLVLTSSLAVFLGRWGQALLYNPGGFRESFHRLWMGTVATLLASAVFVLAGIFNNVLIDNLAIVLLVMFMFQGLAVVHRIVKYKQMHAGWLAAFYGLLVLFFLYVLAIVAGVGLIDNWFDIRARVTKGN